MFLTVLSYTCSFYVLDSPLGQPLSRSLLVFLLVLDPQLHTPHISSPNHHLLFTAHAHTNAACFAAIPMHWYCMTFEPSNCQTVYPQFPHSVADTSWGRLAQLITFCQDQELDLGNEVSPTVAQPPGTLFLPTSTTLPIPVHSENDSRVYFLIVRTTDYCWRSWTSRIAAPYKFHVDWLIDWSFRQGDQPSKFNRIFAYKKMLLTTVAI